MITVHWEVTVPLCELFIKVIFSQMGTARNKSIYVNWHALSKENGDQTIRKILRMTMTVSRRLQQNQIRGNKIKPVVLAEARALLVKSSSLISQENEEKECWQTERTKTELKTGNKIRFLEYQNFICK